MSDMRPVEPIYTAHLFPDLHAELMTLLRGLAPADWSRTTWAAPWTVKDVVAHLLDGQLRKLSICRDGLSLFPAAPRPGYGDLLRMLDGLNAEWVAAARRISPKLLIDLLAVIGPQDAAYHGSLDPHAPALFDVAWAGEDTSPNWLDIGREYTERWHHQQQIRGAVGAPELAARRWLHPVLDVSMRALPHTYRDIPAAEGQAIVFAIIGEAGGTWSLVRQAGDPLGSAGTWRLHTDAAPTPAARVTIRDDIAWRLFFTARKGEELLAAIGIDGDRALGSAVTKALAVMA
jgi:uncharacterized protein (TIGR03083 family)